MRVITDGERRKGNTLSFENEGELWAQPMHESLFIKTELDIESGEFKFKEGGR